MHDDIEERENTPAPDASFLTCARRYIETDKVHSGPCRLFYLGYTVLYNYVERMFRRINEDDLCNEGRISRWRNREIRQLVTRRSARYGNIYMVCRRIRA